MKVILFSAIGMAGIIFGSVGWARIGSGVYPALQLASTVIFLESLLFITGIHSHWKRLRDYLKHLLFLVVLGALLGIFIFDIAGLFIFKAWDYPAYSALANPLGYFLVAPMWGLYFLVFHESYLLIHRLFHGRHHRTHAVKRRSGIFLGIGLLGVMLVIAGVGLAQIMDSSMLGAFVTSMGIWFILEGFEFPRKRTTLLSDILDGNFRPLLAIFIVAVPVAFLSEFFNIIAPVQHWIYFGIPWKHITILNVPVSLLLSWTVMYILFLSLENIIIRTDEVIWN